MKKLLLKFLFFPLVLSIICACLFIVNQSFSNSKEITIDKRTKTDLNTKILISENTSLDHQDFSLNHVEPQIAINPSDPDNWIVVAMVIDSPENWQMSCSMWITSDSGKTWTKKSFKDAKADPWVVFNSKGDAYFSYLSQSSFPDAYRISEDAGSTWTDAIPIGNHDHPFNFSNGSDVYWWSTTKGNRVLDLKKASNGGKFKNIQTFPIDSKFRHDNFLGAVVNKNQLVLPFVSYQPDRRGVNSKGVYFIKVSSDGTLLGEPSLISENVGNRKGVASLHADSSNSIYRDNLYFIYALGQNNNFGGIGVSVSTDLGNTWKDRIIQSAEIPKNKYYCPTAAVNNRGILGVYWYDRRNDPEREENDIYFTASLDGGVTFLAPQKITNTKGNIKSSINDSKVKTIFPGGGHYSGITALPDGSFQLVWSDCRSGKNQLYTSNVIVVKS